MVRTFRRTCDDDLVVGHAAKEVDVEVGGIVGAAVDGGRDVCA